MTPNSPPDKDVELPMKKRPDGFLAPDKIDHDGEIFDYIKELHNILWRVCKAVDGSATGYLRDNVNHFVPMLESRLTTRKSVEVEADIPTPTDHAKDGEALEALKLLQDDLLNSMKAAIDTAPKDPYVQHAIQRVNQAVDTIRRSLSRSQEGK